MRKIINSDQAPAPVGPYNQAVEAAGLLFISGQIALDARTGQLVTGSIEDETRQVMHNIGAILHAAGLQYSDIVKCTVFVRDMGLYSRINAIYADHFQDAIAPARELVEVSGLPKDVNIEISVIALNSGK